MVQQIIQGLLPVKSSSLKRFQTSVPNNASSLDFFFLIHHSGYLNSITFLFFTYDMAYVKVFLQ